MERIEEEQRQCLLAESDFDVGNEIEFEKVFAYLSVYGNNFPGA